MMVIMAIVLTLATTPLTLWCYPPRVRHIISQRHRHRTASSAGAIGGPGGEGEAGPGAPSPASLVFHRPSVADLTAGVRLTTLRFAVVLMRMEQVPAVMTLLKLFQPRLGPAAAPGDDGANEKTSRAPSAAGSDEAGSISVDALRLVRRALSHRSFPSATR